ncbi:MAG: hypothetical protein HY390_05730 [Deltaproteobacteria bacterium]|nr:hypothetical protein [Deltaproteobacteria bacterium]
MKTISFTLVFIAVCGALAFSEALEWDSRSNIQYLDHVDKLLVTIHGEAAQKMYDAGVKKHGVTMLISGNLMTRYGTFVCTQPRETNFFDETCCFISIQEEEI